MKDFKENLQKCQSYIQALEEERRKIQVFQRELPLCLELVTQAIDACKQQLSGASNGITRRECLNNRQNNNNSECTSDNGPIFEEFIPLKRSHCSDDDDDEHHDFHKDEMSDDHINHLDNHDDHDDVDKSEEKSDWLRSVQLWNQTPDPPISHQENQPKRVQVVEVTNNVQQNIEKHEKIKANSDVKKTSVEPANSTCTDVKVVAADRPTGSSSAGGGSTKKEEKGVQRKSRRCWSPELHKRFLHALQQLGGSHAATPKQIRELMKVDGLTNDEVKSHLQKYRLHTRRPSSTTSNNNSNSQQSHQFVVVGGIWMPPSEYNSMAPIATNSRETSPISAPNIYTPIATMASPSSNSQRKQYKQASQSHEERGSHSHGGVHSNSTSTSSSTHTTTASQSH